MKSKKKRFMKQVLSYLLCISMMAPNVTPIAAQGAEYLGNRPRYVNFSSPDILSLEDLGIGTDQTEESGVEEEPGEVTPPEKQDPKDVGSENTGKEDDSGEADSEENGSEGSKSEESEPEDESESEEESKPKDESESEEGSEEESKSEDESEDESKPGEELEPEEEEEVREPEAYYDYDQYIDEPEGELVQFNESYRTYRIGEDQYITVAGGYSGLYRNENGEIGQVDNSLTETEEEYTVGTPSSALMRSRTRTRTGYGNSAGSTKVLFPEKITSGQGISIEKGDFRIELIPSGGSFEKSAVWENSIRYSDVYPGIDYQYR